MNLEQFSTASQDELVDWVRGLSESVASREIDLRDESAISDDELIMALSVIKGLAKENLVIEGDGIQELTMGLDDALFTRGLEK